MDRRPWSTRGPLQLAAGGRPETEVAPPAVRFGAAIPLGGRRTTKERGRDGTSERPPDEVKPPAVGYRRAMRAARRYERLAAVAQDHGYLGVTGPAVKEWLKAGLLPRADVTATGFQQRRVTEPPETEVLLLELCRRRYADPPMRDLALLGLGMWVDGFPLPERGVRVGLRRAIDLPGLLLRRTRVADADVYDLVDRAVFEGGIGTQGVASPADLATGLGDLLANLGGDLEPAAVSADGIAALERVAGAPGFYQEIVRVGGRPIQLQAVLSQLTLAELQPAIDNATARQLEAARTVAAAFGRWVRRIAEQLPSPVPRQARWLEVLNAGLEGDLGRGQVVALLLANPEPAAALQTALEALEQ